MLVHYYDDVIDDFMQDIIDDEEFDDVLCGAVYADESEFDDLDEDDDLNM